MFYTTIGCVEYFVSLYVVQTPWICRVFCVPLCYIHISWYVKYFVFLCVVQTHWVCRVFCVPLCCINHWGIYVECILCSYMLYTPLGNVSWVFRVSRCCTWSFGNSGALHSSLTARTTWIYRVVCFPTFKTYLLVLFHLVFWFHKLKKIQTNIFGA